MPHYLPLNNAPGNLIKGRLFTYVLQQYGGFLKARNISPALLKRIFKDAGSRLFTAIHEVRAGGRTNKIANTVECERQQEGDDTWGCMRETLEK